MAGRKNTNKEKDRKSKKGIRNTVCYSWGDIR